jgi:chromosome segregation ATPase
MVAIIAPVTSAPAPPLHPLGASNAQLTAPHHDIHDMLQEMRAEINQLRQSNEVLKEELSRTNARFSTAEANVTMSSPLPHSCA